MKKKEIWIKLIFFLIVFSLFSYSFINYTTKFKYGFKNNYGENNLVKTSDNEISIVTPENKTYNEPMWGYYPATYGFENDIIGHNPSGWQINENPPIYDFEIVKEKNSHKYVVHIKDNEIGGYRMHYYPNSDIEIGTIELWVLGVDVSDRSLEIVTLDNSSITGITLRLHTDGWYYYGDYGDQLISNTSIPQDNQWHHIRLDFRCSGAVDYMGLTESSYRVYIDGINLGDLSFCEPFFDKLNSFKITTDNISDSEWWVDAIGFSWDPNYNIGDNLNEGLLLSFDNSTNLDWIGYSLDGLANKTILGNVTLPLTANGVHFIQVFGNDSLGAMYISNLRHFTLDVPMIDIITPENKTYLEPMSGYYPATYGFENDINGFEPNKWLRWDPGIGTVRVISEKDDHRKVLEVNDNASYTGDDPGIYQLFSENHTSGVLELWIYKESGNCPIWISLLDTSLTRYITALGIDSYVSQYNNNRFNINSAPGGWQTFGPTFYDDQWYHISISWDGTMKTVDVYINGILEANDYLYTHTDALDADRLEIRSAWGTTGLFYIDAIGYSWDPYYNGGDNFNEGLLLSFYNSTTLDWMAYSLDGLTNKEILGNTTIPMPLNGSHTIQVFGNDSLGIIYASEIQYFSINAPPPHIPPDNSLVIIVSVAIGVFIAAFGIILVVTLIRKKRYEAYKFKEPKKPEIRVKPKVGSLICPYCHNENRIKNNYCIYCGASLLEFKPGNM